MTDFPAAKAVNVGAVTLSVHEAGIPNDKPTIVLVHGWPELAYSWKNQIGPLVDAGFHVLAPNLRGFGASDAPKDIADYSVRAVTDDLVGLLDAHGLEKAIFCGHDWGGAIVWPMAVLNPARVAGVIGVSTPHRAPPPIPPLDILARRFTDRHYMVAFQEPGEAEKRFTGQEENLFRMLFRKPVPREAWPKLVPGVYDMFANLERFEDKGESNRILSDDDLAVYVEAYKTSGFHGGVNLYRNINANYEMMKTIDQTVRAPALWIGAELDLFLPPEGAANMEALVPDLERHVLKDCGHWVTWEQPDALNALMLDWLQRRY
ncbi:MAG: alpha/beta hydrolase [Pseudomonadota bacterium]